MADLVSRTSGNLTDTGTWKNIETGTRAKQAVRSASTNTTTSYVYNADAQDFTIANLAVIEGILLFVNRITSTGTVSVALSEDSGTTATREVTVNAADLPNEPSWVFFKFDSPLTGDGGTDYAIGVRGSSAGNAAFYRDGTAANWTRLIVNNTNPGSVAAGDVFFVVGELTGQGTGNDFTVTMNSTATTDYGTGVDGADVNGMEIGKRGIVSYGTAASTNYYLKLSGSLNVWGDGTLNIGTTGTPIPRTSTAVLEFDPVADGGMGLLVRNGGTLNIQGLSRTAGKNIVSCKLNTDEAAGQTVLGVDTDTGWLSGDDIVIASTTRTASETEKRTLSVNASATELTVTADLTNAHSGTSPTQAEVILLTRNVVVRSATSTIVAYVNFKAAAVVDIDWAEFYYLGENAAGKRGIEIETTAGDCSIQYSSIHDFEDWGIYLPSSSNNNIILSNNTLYNLSTVQIFGAGILVTQTVGTNITITNNILLLMPSSSSNGYQLGDCGLTFNNNTVASTSGPGIALNESGSANNSVLSGNTVHSCSSFGVNFGAPVSDIEFNNFTIWRCNNSGLSFGGVVTNGTFRNGTIFGCSTNSVIFSNNARNLKFINLVSNGDSSFPTTNGINTAAVADLYMLTFIDCSLSVSSGIKTAHTSDFLFNAGGNSVKQIQLINCVLSAVTEFQNYPANVLHPSWIRSHKHDQSGVTFTARYKYGTINQETTTRHTASGYAWRLTPNNASHKLRLPGPTEFDTFKVAVNASSPVTIRAFVRKDSSYNGNAPRLVLVGGITGGIDNDVTDSLTVGADTWEELEVSGTPNEVGVVEFYVDCDGTAGNVFVDDVTVSQA